MKWRRRIVVECTCLENKSTARYREFESHRLRKYKKCPICWTIFVCGAKEQTALLFCEVRKTFRYLIFIKSKSTRRSIGESHRLRNYKNNWVLPGYFYNN